MHYVDDELPWKVPATSRRVQDAAVPVVPQSLLCASVTAGTGPALSSYDLNAAFT